MIPCAILLPAALSLALPTTTGPRQDAPKPAEWVELGDPPSDELAPFFVGEPTDPGVTSPDAFLGFPLGTRPATHGQVVALWRRWDEESDRVAVRTYGWTHEGRELIVGIVTTPGNRARLDGITADRARLADPRGLAAGDEDALVGGTPAGAWMGYSIHGDEMSGVDGGLALAYHLIAGTSEDVLGLLGEVVVAIDPVMNPDGRERFLGLLSHTTGYVPNLDHASLQRGRWPYGRGNHYLFDMNRDWMPGIAPETRGRWAFLRDFHPQLFVDAHEMGGLDTFLFYPQAAPHNPNLPASVGEWQQRFGDEQGAAFDQYGWSYYTREWADAWAPFYSDAWGSLQGAIGILYEQARYAGHAMKRESGEVVTYRDAARHQAVASLANLRTLAANREAILRDYVALRRANAEGKSAGGGRVLVVVPGRHPTRERYLLELLAGQGIEGSRRPEGTVFEEAIDLYGGEVGELELEREAWAFPVAQPLGSLLHAYMQLDPRLPDEALDDERRELEETGGTQIYDTTAWSVVRALDVEAYWCAAGDGDLAGERLAADPIEAGIVAGRGAAYGWAVDGADDASVRFAIQAMERGLAVHASDRAFTVPHPSGEGTVELARGSLLVRRHEQTTPKAQGKVRDAVRASGVVAYEVGTARAPGEGPDLGGGHFFLLARPRVALLSNAPVAPDRFGHLWHELDAVLRMPTTLLDAQELPSLDLRPYNVLVLPPAWGGAMDALIDAGAESLEAWVRSGGTLVAVESAAGAIASEERGLSGVRLLRDVGPDAREWRREAWREHTAGAAKVDPASVWESPAAPARGEDDDAPSEPDFDWDRQDQWDRRFSPVGAFLLGHVDQRSWLTAGLGERMPAPFAGSRVFLSRPPVKTPVRLGRAAEVRLGGLLWPEARARVAESAYVTVERVGHGQVILFAHTPGFRGYHRATARLFANAVTYGPGAADQPVGW